MSSATALNFLLLGGALLLAGSSRLIRTFQFLTLSAVLFSWLGFSHYIFGGAPMPFFSAMAMHTAVCFLLLGAGIFCTRTDGGLMALLVSGSAGGLIARRLLLPALLLVFVINWLEAWIHHRNWFSLGAESSLFALDDIIVFGALVWFNAAWLHRTDVRRVRAEETQAQLAGIVESSDDAIISKTLDGIITSWNRGAEKIFGYSAQEAIGQPMLMLFPPERVNEERDILERIARGENIENFETVRTRKDKKQIHVSATISPVKDSFGKIIGASKIAHDITERKRAEVSLNLFRTLVDRSSDGIEVIDPETGRFLDVNETACQRLGYKREELLSMSVPDIEAVVVDSSSWRKVVEEIRQSGFKILEGRHKRKDGSTFPVEVSVRYIKLDRDYLIAAVRDITERKLVEAALRESEQRLRFTLESCNIGAWNMDLVDHTAYRSLEHARIFGYAELIPQWTLEDFLRHVLPEYCAEVEAMVRKATDARLGWTYECPIRRADGEIRWIWFTGRHFTDPSSGHNRVGGVVMDITERKQAEEARQTSEARYHTLFDYAPDGIVIVDAKGYYLDANASICRMLGYTHDEFIGLNATDIVAPAEIPHIGQALDVIKNKSDYHREWQFRRKDGSVFAVDTIATAMPDGNLLAMIRDITERKRAEESLQLLGSAVEQSKESILITDAELDLPGPKIIFVNPAFTQMTGYMAEEVIGKTPRILQGPRTDKAVLSRLRKNLERGEVFEGETINYRKDGKEFDLEWQIAPLRNASGKITHFVATQHDITARKKLEEQFRQSQKMEGIGQLAGGVAHDFNNILGVIQMQSDLLKAEGNLSPAQSELAEEIGASTQRAAALTRQLLLFSRKETLQLRDLDLNESINDMTKMLRRTIGENVQLQFKFAMQPLFIHADAGMMDQVLMNLAVNARDAMPRGGRLVIETSTAEFDEAAASHSTQVQPGKFVCLSVSDTGCGIPPENLQKIFEPFFTTKDVGKGTGLGLATVFGIVQQHNGWINVYSEVGHGTTFRIYIPRLAIIPDQKFVSPTMEPARGGNETILFVEDEPRLRASVRNVLSRLGYHVLEASDGAGALEIWKQNRDEIRLLLTDMVMPGGMTGKDLGERLLKENPKLKVIYASGYSAEFAGKDFPLKEGVNFLTKPFQASKLAQTIRDSLDTPT
jgi:PAS domain S-box-containing protein